ncbi:glycosyltransferase [Horticoccus sp. 23ND18S-11]|uniref:glycosyltransferase n=1 Tax=Horticoccus sp. 23ND18S-11 TaxID=3391832 RepID=UPI0039C8F525
MKICMMTNTYLPHVGGVARSVSTFAEEYVKMGHEVLVVAPEFDGKPLAAKAEAMVERVPSLRHFNGSEFSVRLPLAAALSQRLDAFQADIIHAHHPFLLGDTALRIAMNKNVPIVFTHHTRYENYTHYVPFAEAMKEIAVQVPTHFANLCDGVIAPSESIARVIKKRGVTTPVKVIPTGIDVAAFASADGARFRQRMKVPEDALVIGHVGRLAPEKNLEFLAESVALFLKQDPAARFLVVGDGPGREALTATFAAHGVSDRLLLAGKRTGKTLREAYRAMNVFAFASKSETQGMVVAEAMAAGMPVVALNASGVREVVKDGENGFLLPASASAADFAAALERCAVPATRHKLAAAAQATSKLFSREESARRALEFYDEMRKATRARRLLHHLNPWTALVQRLGLEWDLLSTRTQTVAAAVFGDDEKKASGA